MKTINDIYNMIVEMYFEEKRKKIAAGKCVSCQSCSGMTNGCYGDMYVLSIIQVARGDY